MVGPCPNHHKKERKEIRACEREPSSRVRCNRLAIITSPLLPLLFHRHVRCRHLTVAVSPLLPLSLCCRVRWHCLAVAASQVHCHHSFPPLLSSSFFFFLHFFLFFPLPSSSVPLPLLPLLFIFLHC